MSIGQTKPIIIDLGSYSCRAGYADAVLPTIIKYKSNSREEEITVKKRKKKVHVYPFYFDDGRKKFEWNFMEQFYEDLYDELAVTSGEHPVFLTEPQVLAGSDRDKIGSIFFEKLNVPALCSVTESPLCLYSAGLTTGVVVDVGYRFTRIQSFFENYSSLKSFTQINLGGRDLTQNLEMLMTEMSYSSHTKSGKQVIIAMKETKAYVALDYEDELLKYPSTFTGDNQAGIEEKHILPDGSQVIIKNQRFRCTEPIFTPYLIGKQYSPLPDMIDESIRNCETIYRKELFNNIVLTGGTTLLPGFAARMYHEMEKFAPTCATTGIIANDNRQYAAWIGGTLVASCESLNEMWCTKAEYEECGSSILTRKKNLNNK